MTAPILRTALNGTLTALDAKGATSVAQYSITQTGGSIPPATGDGSANAPAGTPKYPNLFSGLVRPVWQCAGVDFPVGINAGVVLKVPSATNLPAGAELYMGAVYIKKALTLDGYDLSGLTVMMQDPINGTVKIRNCSTKRNGIIRTSSSNLGIDLIVEYCYLDGGGVGSDTNFATIQTWCPTTVRYCYIGQCGQGIHVSGKSCIIEFNFWEKFAYGVGQHANAIYIGGGGAGQVVAINYNVVYSGPSSPGPPNGPIGIGAAIALFDDGGSYTDWTINNNVVMAEFSHCASYLIGPYVTSPLYATGGKVNNNFCHSANGWNGPNSGAFGPFYHSPGQVQATSVGNTDMADGKLLTTPW